MTSKREFSSRWGDAIADDVQWCHIPGYILRNYSKCVSVNDIKDETGKIVMQRGQVSGVDMQDMMFVVHIMAFKYDTPDAKAAPSLKTIADYAGLSINSVRRIKQRLINYGLLAVEHIKGKPDVYDFTGLHGQCVRLESGLSPVEGLDVYTPPKNRSTHTFRSTTPPKNRSTPLQEMGGEELSIEKGKKENISASALIDQYIKAWLDGQSVQPVTNQYGNKTNRTLAKAVADGGYSTEQLTTYTRSLANTPYWKDKLVSFKYVGDNIAAAYKGAIQTPPTSSAPPPSPPEAERPQLSPEQAAQRQADFARIMADLLAAKVEKTVAA